MTDSWQKAYESESLPAGYSYDGAIKMGRPKILDVEMVNFTIRIPAAQKAALEREAQQRDISTSGYLREIIAMRHLIYA